MPDRRSQILFTMTFSLSPTFDMLLMFSWINGLISWRISAELKKGGYVFFESRSLWHHL